MQKSSKELRQPTVKQHNVSGSALIADFLGWENYGDGVTYKFPNLYPIYNIDDKENTGWTTEQISKAEFNTRWDWLMPVVFKIMRTKIGDGVDSVEYPYLRTFGMINAETKNPMVRFHGFQLFEAETLIEATFLAVVDFLEWWSKA